MNDRSLQHQQQQQQQQELFIIIIIIVIKTLIDYTTVRKLHTLHNMHISRQGKQNEVLCFR